MLSSSLKNSILALALSSLIRGTDAAVSCGSTSLQCCWVVRSWQLMGKSIPTGISSTDNSCCTVPMYGVTCNSTNKVTMLKWGNDGLSGSIPAEIGKLTSLTHL